MEEFLFIFIIISTAIGCGYGILYGVGIGYVPIFVYLSSIALNFLANVTIVFLTDRLLKWKSLGERIKKRLARVQKLIDKYGSFGLVIGVSVLSTNELSIIGKLLCIKPSRLYASLLVANILNAALFLGIALGIFKVLLHLRPF